MQGNSFERKLASLKGKKTSTKVSYLRCVTMMAYKLQANGLLGMREFINVF